mmetsp:Transcript_24683/g.49297  ORF Transcript_24683/g.49297 Transcript_24683/m.49297 type:complete len:229 (+) Transcript_24683:655-1341(+)
MMAATTVVAATRMRLAVVGGGRWPCTWTTTKAPCAPSASPQRGWVSCPRQTTAPRGSEIWRGRRSRWCPTRTLARPRTSSTPSPLSAAVHRSLSRAPKTPRRRCGFLRAGQSTCRCWSTQTRCGACARFPEGTSPRAATTARCGCGLVTFPTQPRRRWRLPTARRWRLPRRGRKGARARRRWRRCLSGSKEVGSRGKARETSRSSTKTGLPSRRSGLPPRATGSRWAR